MKKENFWAKIRKHILNRRQPFSTFSFRFFLPQQSAGVKIHRYVFLHIYQEFPLLLRILAIFYNLSRWWLFYSFKEVYFAFKAGSAKCLEKYNIHKTRQLFDLLSLAFAYCIPPLEYYHLTLHKWPRAKWLDFAYDFQAISWHEALNYKTAKPSRDLINNKADLEKLLIENNLKTINSLQIIKPETEITEDDVAKLPDEFFIKPAIGNRGSGCLRVKKDFSLNSEVRFEFTWFSNSAIFKYKTLKDLNNVIRAQEYLLQPVIVNYAKLTQLLGTDELATIRLITAKNNSKIQAVSAVLEAARPYNPSTYWNLVLDIKTGEFLQPEYPVILENDEFTNWFNNLQGQIYPELHEMKSLCFEAHAKLPDMLTIGWDLALGPDGPLIVEGNSIWGLQQYQNLMQIPLAETELGEIYIDFIKK